MNKSEIAEKATDEILSFVERCDSGYVLVACKKCQFAVKALVERAIAESQAPTGTISQGGCSGTMPVYGAELGDGEPSPPPDDELIPLDDSRCAVCGWTLAETREKGCRPGDCSLRPLPPNAYDTKRANREYAGRREFKPALWESGAAQAVSPIPVITVSHGAPPGIGPGPSATGTSSDPRTGYSKQEEVSPPSPDIRERLAKALWEAEIAEEKFRGNPLKEWAPWPEDSARQPYCQLTYRVADFILPLFGDTRELKAALRWIPVEEKLPETTAQYLVWVRGIGGDGEMFKESVEAVFSCDRKHWTVQHGWLSHEVQGWMPMPKPPELG